MANNDINLIYNISVEDRSNGIINIFGTEFMKNNKEKCKIEYNNKEYELTSEFDIKNINTNSLEIKLKD